MPMVNSKEMFKKAYEGGYAIGAFNVNNMEIIQGITEGAKLENAPLILQVSAGARKYAKHVYLMKMIEAAIADTDLPIVVHLDHGPDFETCKSCIDGGFTSVMIDGSHLPFEENIALTRKVVDYAHERNVTVEAELGRLAGVEDDVKVSAEDSSYTQPDEVEEFATRTGCDSLAIAIGTSHGAFKFKGEPKLRFDILEEVSRRLPGFPIVLHGASSVIPSYVEMINQYGGNMPGAQGVPAPTCAWPSPASCASTLPSTPITSTRASISPTPATASGRWCATRSSTSWAATARPDPSALGTPVLPASRL